MKKLSFILLLIIFKHNIYAQNNMGIDDCIKYALTHQLKIKNALIDQKTTVAKNKEISGVGLPSVKATAGINYAPLVAGLQMPNSTKYLIQGMADNHLIDSAIGNAYASQLPSSVSFALQPKWTSTATLQVSQILFDPSVMVALQARKGIEELAEKLIEQSEQEVKIEVTKAYYNLLIAEKRIELLNQNIDRLTELKKETNEIYKTGLAEKLDVDRLSVTLSNLQSEKIKVKQFIDLAYLALKFQMGMPLDEKINLTDNLDENIINESLLNANVEINDRKEYQLLTIQKKLNEYDFKRYKLGGLPSLILFGNYGYTLYDQKSLFAKLDNWQKSSIIGLNFSVPLFDGFQRKEKMKQTLFSLQKIENNMEQLKQGVNLENESAKVKLSTNLLSLQNQKENMQLAKQIFETTRIKYKEGIGSNLEIINAETALKEAQTNYFNALFDVAISRIDLLKALGKL